MRVTSHAPMSPGWFLKAALTVGVVYGVFEAAASQLLSHWGGSLSWKNGTGIAAFVVSPLFYGVLFAVLALPFLAVSRFIHRVRWDAVMLWALTGLAAYTGATLMRHWFSVFASVMIGLGVATSLTRWYLRRREPRAARLGWLAPRVALGAVAVAAGTQAWQHWSERQHIAGLPAPPADAPNVLLLVLDTERGDHLSVNGYARRTTPHLEMLAREGINYSQAVSPAPTTLPSHASMMTGRRVLEHRAGRRGRRYLDNRFPTIAETLAQHGYATGGFVANVYWTGRHTGLSRGFIRYRDFYGTLVDGICRTVIGRELAYSMLPRFGQVDIPGRKRASRVNEELLDWLDDLPEGRPYFAFVNYFDVHAPYSPPAPYLGRFGKGRAYQTDRIEIGAWNEHDRLPPAATLATWRDRYDESLSYLDQQIGNLMDSLEARGTLENTVIIVTSDHGEAFGEHQMVHHGGSLYLEQIHVPLLIRDPGSADRGLVISEPVDLRALPSTISDLVGIDSSPFPGTSLIPGDSTDGPAAPALTEGPRVSGNPLEWPTGRGWVMSLLEDHWHVIALESGDFEVYDLDQDPEELHNIANAIEGREVLAALADELRSILPPSRPAESGDDEP